MQERSTRESAERDVFRISNLGGQLVPTELRTDPGSRRMALTTILFSLSMAAWAGLFLGIYLWLGSPRCALIVSGAVVACLANAFSLGLHGSVRAANNTTAGIVLVTLLALTAYSGGAMSPAMIWLPSVPMIAVLLCGWRQGLTWFIATAASAWVVFLLDGAGWMPESDFTGDTARLLYILGLVGIIGCATLLCFVFEFNARALRSQLESARSSAEQASRAKSGFLARMSHEIRTPMNGVIGMLELLANTDPTRQQREYTLLARQSAESLLRLLNDILDFSKIEAGRLELESIPFDLNDLVSDTLQALAGDAAEKGLDLACHIPPDAPSTMTGDPGRLRQILVNLVGNAIKFTADGEVVVSVSVQALGAGRARLHFSVRDTGIGIAPAKQERIFEAFGQGDSSTTRRYGGTGLGLSISRQLIEMMGGQLALETEEGRGTTFLFTIETGVSDGVGTGTGDRRSAVSGARVLVVDDNATNRFVLQELLTSWKMPVTCVEGAEAAMGALGESASGPRAFQIVLLDMMMPDVDGLMLAEQIQDDPRFQDVPLVMLSSSWEMETVDRCEALGIVAQLRKPVKHSALLDAILFALDQDGEHAPPQRAQQMPRAETPARILLAEDGLVNQKVALGILGAQGHNVTLAENGRQAVEAWEADHFDIILMDVEMPEMDGFEATRAIREREGDSGLRTPIVAMTAHAIAGYEERCREAGMDGHIPKPVDPQRLHRVIMQLTSRADTSGEGGPG